MAERGCSINACPNTIDNKVPGTRFFRFPKKKHIQKLWIERCNRPGTWNPDLCLVCSDHFDKSDYSRDLRVKVDGPDNGLRLNNDAVPWLQLDGPEPGHAVFGNCAVVARTNMMTMISRQKKIDIALQPKSDPLALNNEEQGDDTDFTECKAEIADLVDPKEYAVEDHDQSAHDPLDISDIQSQNPGCTKQGNLTITDAENASTQNKEEAHDKFHQSDNAEAQNSLCEPQVRASFSDTPCIICQLLHVKPFSSLSPDQQKKIMLEGKPLCNADLLNNIRGHRQDFCLAKNSEKLWWITSSNVLHKIFCWPCLLFGKKDSPWNSVGLNHALPDEVQRHEKSPLHVSSFLKYTMFAKDCGVHATGARKRRQQISTPNSEIGMKKVIFCRLIDAICILSNLEMPKNKQGVNQLLLTQQTYEDIVETFGEYDASLKSYLQSVNENNLTSQDIRDDLTHSIESVMLDSIKQEVESAQCVSIICGEVSDDLRSKNETLFTSVVLRFVDSEGIVRERFIGYKCLVNTGCYPDNQRMWDRIWSLIADFKLEDKLVVLSNDGQHDLLRCTADTTSIFRNVIYVPSFRKSLNSVLRKVLSRIEECQLFVSMLPRLAAFFSKESKKRLEFEQFLHKVVPKFVAVPLDFDSNLERTVFRFLPQFLKFFQNIIENPAYWDEDTVVSALGFKAFLQSFSTICLLHLFSQLFNQTNSIYKTPEFMTFSDYTFWAARVCATITRINGIRENFQRIWMEILAKEENCDLAGNRPQTNNNSEEAFKLYTILFSKIIKMAADYVAEELASFEKLKCLDLLNPKCFGNKCPSSECLDLLESSFPSYFDIDKLRSELILLYRIDSLKTKLPDKYIGSLGTLKDAEQFVEVHKLVCLYLTVPCTQASLDPLFSALKRMKNVYEMHGHDPSSNLAVLAIEKKLLSQLRELPDFYSNVMNEYAKREKVPDIIIDYSMVPKVSKLMPRQSLGTQILRTNTTPANEETSELVND